MIVVLASGRGSHFVNLAEKPGTPIARLLTDNPGAPVLERARERAIPAEVVAPGEPTHARLVALAPDWIVLAGYMRVLPAALIEDFRRPDGLSRIINIHPSLLPSFKGLHAVRRAYESGCKLIGHTVHFVEPEVDAGPIFAQGAIDVRPEDTLERVERRNLEAEHATYLWALQQILDGAFDYLAGDPPRVRPHRVRD